MNAKSTFRKFYRLKANSVQMKTSRERRGGVFLIKKDTHTRDCVRTIWCSHLRWKRLRKSLLEQITYWNSGVSDRLETRFRFCGPKKAFENRNYPSFGIGRDWFRLLWSPPSPPYHPAYLDQVERNLCYKRTHELCVCSASENNSDLLSTSDKTIDKKVTHN